MRVVVGASTGGMQALENLVSQLPKDLSAPVCIVILMSPDTTGEAFIRRLDEPGAL